MRLTVEYAILLAVSALVMTQFGIHAVALGCTAMTVLYLPRLLQLYLRPIDCPIVDFLRVLAPSTAVALAIFIAHRTLISFVEIDAWPQIGLAVAETVVGYALLLWFDRRGIALRLKEMRAIFSA